MQLYRRPLCTRFYRRVRLGVGRGGCADGLPNDLVAFHMEWSSADRLVMYDSLVTFRIDCRTVRRRRVSVLYNVLSIRLQLYSHLLRARRFSVTNALMYRVWDFPMGSRGAVMVWMPMPTLGSDM
jgi:hypothetical protein